MSESLRDRIAKVLWTRFGPQIELGVDGTWEEQHPVARKMWREDADEIILALGLRQQWLVDGYKPFDVKPPEWDQVVRIRYVTDWKVDDE